MRKLLLLLFCLSIPPSLHAEPRVALVLGNGGYPAKADLFGPLVNPRHDAADMAQMLRGYGFRIITAGDARRACGERSTARGLPLDADLRMMECAVEAFSARLDKNGTGLFFFSGHGVQVESHNWLLPVGRNFRDGRDVKYHALNAHWVLEKMSAAGSRVNIMILDACRQQLPLGQAKGFQSKGFAQMGATGAIIAYATALDGIAWGNADDRHSLYTGKLLAAMRAGGHLPIERIFKQSRTAVAQLTDFKQVPWTGNGLTGADFCLEQCGEGGGGQKQPGMVWLSDTVFRDTLGDGSPGPEMVVIPAGSFRMGDIQGDGGSDEQPVHRVNVEKFAIGRYEVTVAEFRRFVRATGYRTEAELDDGCYVRKDGNWGYVKDANWRKPYFPQQDNQPVVCVSRNDATAYSEWLSQASGQRYRLPTEAEWEYAARAGTESRYWWGDDLGANRANCDGCGSRWDDKQTAPAGSFAANPFGLYDTAGNVWEWTCSAYTDKYDGQETACLSKNHAKPGAVRGGSWYSLPRGLRSAYRYNRWPSLRSNTLGFRPARMF